MPTYVYRCADCGGEFEYVQDFEDPALTELRRQLQETINRTLGKAIIEEVIITDLSVDRVASRAPAEPAPAEPALDAGNMIGGSELRGDVPT